jgi:hypothetical protein
MVGPPDVENARAIAGYGGVAVVGQMPMLGHPLSPELVARWAETSLDPDQVLMEFLR